MNKLTNIIFVVILYIILAIFGIIIIFRMIDVSNKQTVARYSTEIPPTVITYGNNRGIIPYGDDMVISATSELIGDIGCKDIWIVQNYDLYDLGNLKTPFILSKKSNSDTIIVKKDSYLLKFLLDNVNFDDWLTVTPKDIKESISGWRGVSDKAYNILGTQIDEAIEQFKVQYCNFYDYLKNVTRPTNVLNYNIYP